MADSRAATGLRVQQWDDKFFVEYIQKNLFSRYFGKDENSIIQVKEDLTKKRGDRLTYALVNKLVNDATTGSDTLEGNEEDMVSRSHRLTVNKRRNAVRISEMEEQKSALSLRNAARRTLMDWSMEDTRDQVIAALASINGVAYGAATETQKDAWLVDNADRVLFGALKSNNSSNDHSASLSNVDNTDDKFSPTTLSLMKRLALQASPKIKPITVDGGKRFYVAFAGNRTFRDFKDNATIQQAQREVVLRMQNIKLFEGGDQEWDGIIVHEVDDIPVYANVGASGTTDVSPVYLCGAQAIGLGWAKRWRSAIEKFDYGDKYGTAMEAIMGIEKLNFGSGSDDTDDLKQHGVVTGYFAAVDDS
jgi:N4-gp56 family major capsid protein